MKVVDEGRMLPNDQAQGSIELNNKSINVEAKVKVREKSLLDIFESVLLPSSIFLHIAISHTFVFFSSLLLGSNPSIESGG